MRKKKQDKQTLRKNKNIISIMKIILSAFHKELWGNCNMAYDHHCPYKFPSIETFEINQDFRIFKFQFTYSKFLKL